jgi:hypothetical protein
MNAYTGTRGFAAPARSSRFSSAPVSSDALPELHNSRGLVIAVLMSATCWAGVGLAFLI